MNNQIVPKRTGKPSITASPRRPHKDTRSLEKKVAAGKKVLKCLESAEVYDDKLDLLSDDGEDDISESSDVDFDTSGEEDEEDEEDSRSRSLSSDDQDSSEETRLATKKRHASEALASIGGKKPRLSSFEQARALCVLKEAEVDAELHNREELSLLLDTIKLRIIEMDRINDTVVMNIQQAQQEIARLEEKEKVIVLQEEPQQPLFVIDTAIVEKELKEREEKLKQREEMMEVRFNEDIERHLAEQAIRHTQLLEREALLEQKARAIQEQEENLNLRAVELNQRGQQQEAERKEIERKLALLIEKENAKQPLVPVDPLDAFITEMNKTNQNMMTRADMMGVVPDNLLKNLAYIAGKSPLKYNSLSNGSYHIFEASALMPGDAPSKLLLRNIVSKQLYTPK